MTHDEDRSVFSSAVWMVGISLVLFFLPAINGLIGGVVGAAVGGAIAPARHSLVRH